jgi:HEAT repeat protein
MMSRRNPYKLFDYYTEADAEVFFGREREVSAVLGDILANKLLVLFAASGSGKTSLLNAGIGPALRQIGQADGSDPGIRMITIRLAGGVPPEESALRAIKAELRETGQDGETLHQLLRRLCAIPKPAPTEKDSGLSKPPLGLVLVFDQFEELFISLFKHQPETRREFGVKLAEIIHDETLRAYVVLSLRSDHFHHLNEFRSLIPSIFQNNTNLELRPFDRETALRVIRGPADRTGSGFSWELGLPERIVQDLEGLSDERGRVLPIHLQIVCYDLFNMLGAGDDTITLAHYKGTADRASMASGSPPAEAMIRRRIIDPLEAITGRERRRWLYRLLRELMTAVGAKFPRSLTGLSSIVPARHLPTLLEHLEKRLLVRRIVAESETYYELRHDFLARRISPWLEGRESELRASDRRRRSAIIAVAIFLTVLATKLWLDWSTFTGFLGFDPRPDELRLERKAPLGLPPPSWWKRNIFTGYFRTQLLAAGLKQHRFEVEKPLTDWKDIGEQLNIRDRWLLQLATRFKHAADEPDATDAILLETIQHPDIGIVAVVDGRVLDLVISGLQSADLRIRSSAAKTLGGLANELPPKQVSIVAQALLAALGDRDSSGRNSVVLALGNLGENFPPERVDTAVESLLATLKDQDPVLKKSAATALGRMGKSLPEKHLAPVVDALLAALKEQGSEFNWPAREALVRLVRDLPPENVERIVEPLLATLQGTQFFAKISAEQALGNLSEKLAAKREETIVEPLLFLLQEQDIHVKIAAAAALCSFGKTLPAEDVGKVVAALLTAFDGEDLFLKGRASEAFKNLIEKLPPERLGAVADQLFARLHEQNLLYRGWVAGMLRDLEKKLPTAHARALMEGLVRVFKNSKDGDAKRQLAAALSSLSKKLPAESIAAVIETLLAALKEQDPSVRASAAKALGELGSPLSTDQVDTVADALLTVFEESQSYDKNDVAAALINLCGRLAPRRVGAVLATVLSPTGRGPRDFDTDGPIGKALRLLPAKLPVEDMDRVAEALLAAIKQPDTDLQSLAAKTLGGLGPKLPPEIIGQVCDALLAALKENSIVKKSAAEALGGLTQKLSAERVSHVAEALLATLNEKNSYVIRSVAPSLATLGAHTASYGEPSFFLELDALPSLDSSYEAAYEREGFLAALRTLASAKWPQTDAELLAWLESDDGRLRIFALHVLARRQPLKPEVLDRVVALRNDPKGRPWVKVAALRCLVEIEREKDARHNDTAKNPN